MKRQPNLDNTQRRLSSTVTRQVQNDRAVYVKQYSHGDWDRTAEIVCERANREVKLLSRMEDSQLFRGRLGLLRLVSATPQRATLVTEEVPGVALTNAAASREFRRPSRESLCALFLAGRWLQRFQSLPLLVEDEQPVGGFDFPDLVDYCDFRLQQLAGSWFGWPSDHVRSQICQVLHDLDARSSNEDRRFVWTHSDYYPGNLIWSGRTLTAIDFGTAHAERPLLDVTYFIFRLQMLRVYRPWQKWPITTWTTAFLRGYGRVEAEQSPMFEALMIRHRICRLLAIVRRPPASQRQAIHDRYVLKSLRYRLQRTVSNWL